MIGPDPLSSPGVEVPAFISAHSRIQCRPPFALRARQTRLHDGERSSDAGHRSGWCSGSNYRRQRRALYPSWSKPVVLTTILSERKSMLVKRKAASWGCWLLELETPGCPWLTERERTAAGCNSYSQDESRATEGLGGSAPFPASGAPTVPAPSSPGLRPGLPTPSCHGHGGHRLPSACALGLHPPQGP